MRKTFNLLFICLIALYGWIGYQVIHTTDLPQCQPEGSLSDVAEEVIAIPLKTNGHCSLNKIKMIKRDREDIFLVSDRQLYHFPEHSGISLFAVYDRFGVLLNDRYERAADAGHADDGRGHAVCAAEDHAQVGPLLRRTAAAAGEGKRIYRRNDGRREGRQGVHA